MSNVFPYNWIFVALLALIGICQAVTMFAFLSAARRLRRTSEKTDQTLELTRQLLTRANRSMEEVQGVLHRACGAVSQSIDQFHSLRSKAQTFWAQQFGNGHRGRVHRQSK